MPATLKGPYGQTILEPTANPYTIGRSQDNQLVVQDAKVSSHHAEIRSQGQNYEIVDLASSNGTFVNEQRLAPYTPRPLSNGDQIRFGDTVFLFDAGVMPSQPQIEPTVYGGPNQGSNPSYPPTVAAPPSFNGYEYGAQQGGYTPPPPVAAPPPSYGGNNYGYQQSAPISYPPAAAPVAPVPEQKRSRRGLFLIIGAIIAVLLIAGIAFGALAYVNRSTPTKTLNAFCTALKAGDYQTAYNQLSSGLQAKFGSEAAFAAGFSNNEGLGKVTSCSVSNVNDGAGTGTINYTFSKGSALPVDYTLVNENGWKINAQNPRSTPTLTLNTYCSALTAQDYQTAYNQFSKNYQNQIGSESGFASAAATDKIKGCTVDSVQDSAGTAMITYVRTDGLNIHANETLTNEQGTWKINNEQFVSTPTLTLLNYCNALKNQDYQTAYNQLSSAQQSQQTESQFASNFDSVTVNDCTVSNVNDTAGTGEITYTLNGSTTATFDYTLVDENNTWKINTEKQHQ
ncbi:MAG TPA: FHA domain-containing protein [Ktedonobacteraceae bacterium]|nr:FHA domain-containing protein [Ktedonobacteraceae bacterium]